MGIHYQGDARPLGRVLPFPTESFPDCYGGMGRVLAGDRWAAIWGSSVSLRMVGHFLECVRRSGVVGVPSLPLGFGDALVPRSAVAVDWERGRSLYSAGSGGAPPTVRPVFKLIPVGRSEAFRWGEGGCFGEFNKLPRLTYSSHRLTLVFPAEQIICYFIKYFLTKEGL